MLNSQFSPQRSQCRGSSQRPGGREHPEPKGARKGPNRASIYFDASKKSESQRDREFFSFFSVPLFDHSLTISRSLAAGSVSLASGWFCPSPLGWICLSLQLHRSHPASDERRRQHGGAGHPGNGQRDRQSLRRADDDVVDDHSAFLTPASLFPRSQTESSSSQGTEIVIRAATGSLAQMRHVVGQFPLVRESFPCRCRRRRFLLSRPPPPPLARSLPRSLARSLFRSFRPNLGGCGSESSSCR